MNHKSERALSVKPPRDSAATVQALALVTQGWTAYRAAKHVGIALSTIYRAVARQRARNATAPTSPR